MLVVIFGTRPESLKLGPVVAALKADWVPHAVLQTGQHSDLLKGTPAETDLADSEHLGIPATGEIIRWGDTALPIIQAALTRHKASLVVVQGDTSSAVVGARAADQLGIPLAHVEAGIRSHDLCQPWPEERFRVEITQLSAYHYTPTLCSYDNLIAEGVNAEQIFLTGNPGVSAIERYTRESPVANPDPVILFTMHRREWLLSGIQPVLNGLRDWAEQNRGIEIVWPMHPGTAKLVPETWTTPPNLKVIEPLEYKETMRLLARSLGVATDSGGLQEEAAYFGVPCAVMRRVTDRPESVDAGIARLFAPSYDGVQEGLTVLAERGMPREPMHLYGTPLSAGKIAVLLKNVDQKSHLAPTLGGQ